MDLFEMNSAFGFMASSSDRSGGKGNQRNFVSNSDELSKWRQLAEFYNQRVNNYELDLT